MTTTLGALRHRLMTPPLGEVEFRTRRFHAHDPAAQLLLELCGRQLVMGFGFAMESTGTAETVTRLETLERGFRGFAYEGAAMAMALRDALRPGARGRRNEDLLGSDRGAAHIYLGYIGIGLALARLPRFLWARALPDLSRLPEHPTLSWFIWDGYGFHQAFFDPARWIGAQHVGGGYPWPAEYVNRAIDQGIGRALWFYHGAGVESAAEAVARFPRRRQGDLWSGLGLAASYAGGVGADGLSRLTELAGPYRAEVFLGAVLALQARVRADTVTAHSTLAAEVICGMPAVEAAGITDRVAVDLPPDREVPAYEVLRERIRQRSPVRTG